MRENQLQTKGTIHCFDVRIHVGRGSSHYIDEKYFHSIFFLSFESNSNIYEVTRIMIRSKWDSALRKCLKKKIIQHQVFAWVVLNNAFLLARNPFSSRLWEDLQSLSDKYLVSDFRYYKCRGLDRYTLAILLKSSVFNLQDTKSQYSCRYSRRLFIASYFICSIDIIDQFHVQYFKPCVRVTVRILNSKITSSRKL